MKLEHRGVTVVLADDDPRTRLIETLLFLPSDAESSQQTTLDTAPVDWLKVEPVEPWLSFWRQLNPLARAWLASLLAHGPIPMTQVKKHVKLGSWTLPPLHRHIQGAARRNGLPALITHRGHGRDKRYLLAEQVVAPLSKYAKAPMRSPAP